MLTPNLMFKLSKILAARDLPFLDFGIVPVAAIEFAKAKQYSGLLEASI
jgi:hypothetical protein